MAGNLTPKQDTFAMSYVETGNASEAYRRAYDVGADTKPETVWVKASELLKNGKVAARIVELQEAARGRHKITIDTLTAELEKARAKAMGDDKGASAAVTAIMGKAKIHGLITDRAELTGKNGGPIEAQITRIERIIVSPNGSRRPLGGDTSPGQQSQPGANEGVK